MVRIVINAKSAKPTVETARVGIQNNRTLKTISLLRLATKNNPNDNIATIQNLGEKALSTDMLTSAPDPVALEFLRNGQTYANSAISIAASTQRVRLT